MIKSKPIPIFDHERFLSNISTNNGGCWVWNGFINNYGYGEFGISGKRYRAHRVSFSLFSGELVNGMVIDHICKNKACVNPDHLRQVTQKFNCLDNSSSPPAINSVKTHCKYGHELTDDNVYKHSSGRYCLTCRKRHKDNWIKKYRNPK